MNAAECAARLQHLLADFASRKGIDQSRWRGIELSQDELGAFARAVEGGIVAIEDDATVTFPGLRTANPPKRYQLFLNYAGGKADPEPVMSWSWQEMFCQVAFAAELVLDHGWDPGGVVLEIGQLDVGAGHPDSVFERPLLLAEAKLHDAGNQGLEAMMRVFRELNGTASTAQVAKGVWTNAERKYRSLQRFRPTVFVEVAPNVRRAHRIDHRAGELFFERLHAIPDQGAIAAM